MALGLTKGSEARAEATLGCCAAVGEGPAPTDFTLHPASYTLHPTPYIPNPTPYTTGGGLAPEPYTAHPTPCTLHQADPQFSTPNLGGCGRCVWGVEPEDRKPETEIPKIETRNPTPEIRNPKPETLHPNPYTRTPNQETLHPKPYT